MTEETNNPTDPDTTADDSTATSGDPELPPGGKTTTTTQPAPETDATKTGGGDPELPPG